MRSLSALRSLTQYVDYTDRQTCVLFGDGAGAAVLGPVDGNRGILAAKIKSDGRYEEQLYSPGGGTRRRPTAETLAAGDHFFKMRGNELFKVAVRSMTEISRDVLETSGLSSNDVDLVIPHQANQRITEAVASKLNIDLSKVYSNIAVHGNTSSASIPIALDECVESGRVNDGDVLLLTSFGRRRNLGQCRDALVARENSIGNCLFIPGPGFAISGHGKRLRREFFSFASGL
jgi:3-oxoacyl-[acyl-carrier-protein] synthase-3